MFDLGWTELLVIGVVALIVVGPKDLPKMFRSLGQMTAKARSMAREFSRAMEDAADESGVKDVARDLRGVADPQGMGLDEFKKMKNWDPLRDDPKSEETAGAAPGDDEDEIDRIATEMDSMRSDAAKRAAPDPKSAARDNAAQPDSPEQVAGAKSAAAETSESATKAAQAPHPKTAGKTKAKAGPEGSTDSTT